MTLNLNITFMTIFSCSRGCSTAATPSATRETLQVTIITKKSLDPSATNNLNPSLPTM